MGRTPSQVTMRYTHSVRLLIKLDHVLLWILSKENFNEYLAMFCLYTLPLVRPAKAKIKMLTTSSWIVTILLKSLLKFLGLYEAAVI